MAKKIPAFRLKPMPMEETAMNRSNGQVIEESNDPVENQIPTRLVRKLNGETILSVTNI